jgi:putative ABC transport system permease protein
MTAGQDGIMITAARAADIAAATGKEPSIGDMLSLSFYSSGDFQLATLPLRAIIAYPVANEALDSIVLVDAGTMRSLVGLAREAMRKDSGAKGISAASIDHLFAGASDVKINPRTGLKLPDVEALLREDSPPEEASASSAWNYLLIRLARGTDAGRAAASLDAAFSSLGIAAAARDWRATAGASALYISWLRVIFDIGSAIILAAGAIIIVNALVIAVFERRSEIGTMRALGASRSFVRRLFVAETMILMLGSAIVGAVMAAVLCAIVSRKGIPITNATAVTLFGSARIRPVATIRAAFFNIAAATCVGAIAWIYPVHLALRIEPARAISEK